MFHLGLFHYLILSAILFCIGLFGVMVSRNLIRVLMCSEIMLNAVNINFIAFSNYVDISSMSGNVFALFVMAIAVCEVGVGLIILMALMKNSKNIDVNKQDLLKD
jgi:NADH:ubiquinone oxidoreductase subunit K